MKRALAGLTTRGRSFVAAGLTAIACAFVLGERDLLRAGMLVLSLPLLSALAVSRTRYRLACARKLVPVRVTVGQEARVQLRLKNVSRLPTGLLLIEDRVPYTLGGRARFLIDRVEPHGTRDLGYRIRSEVRGRFRVGPLIVRLADPFGLVELGRAFKLADNLVILPPVVLLPQGPLPGSRAGGADAVARRMASAGEDDVGAREYRHGDDLRRVHWRSTARRGEIMVRREEQHSQNTGTVLLDTRRMAHWGDGPAASFEQAVSVAASVAVHLVRSGVELRLVTDTGRPPVAPGTAEGALEAALLDALAVMRRSDGRSLGPGLTALRVGPGGERADEGLVVAVFAGLTAQEARSVIAAGQGGSGRIAILIEAGRDGTDRNPARTGTTASEGSRDRAMAGVPVRGESPATESPRSGRATDGSARAQLAAARLLRAAGWRVLVIRSASDLASAWARGMQARGRSRPRSDATHTSASAGTGAEDDRTRAAAARTADAHATARRPAQASDTGTRTGTPPGGASGTPSRPPFGPESAAGREDEPSTSTSPDQSERPGGGGPADRRSRTGPLSDSGLPGLTRPAPSVPDHR